MNYREKNTKIVATIATQRCEPEFLQELFNCGMDAVRLNSAHLSTESAMMIIKNVRKVSPTIPIIIDTKGPEIRTLNIPEPIELEAGQEIRLIGPQEGPSEIPTDIQVSFAGIVHDIPVGNAILIDDGSLELTVIDKAVDALICRVEYNGEIKNRKSVNVPNVHIQLPALSAKDLEFLHFAVEAEVDFIAHSFVRSKDDVLAIKTILEAHGSDAQIIAKIENRQGVDNIDEILDHVYGIMVARGDLAIEVKAAEVPLIQKNLIKKSIARSKPVIVATQMLESMISQPRATRAEVSDVANAIIDGTSALMLSGETAYGEYPVEAVRTMAEISQELRGKTFSFESEQWKRPTTEVRTALCKSAAYAAVELNAKAFVVPTRTGTTAMLVSSFRTRKPIYAQCQDPKIIRRLALSHGIRVSQIEPHKNTDEMVSGCLTNLTESGAVHDDDLIVFLGGPPTTSPEAATNFLRIDKVGNLITPASIE